MARLRMKTEKRREESRGHSSRVEEKEEEQEERTEGLPPQGQEPLQAAKIQQKRE